MMTGGKDPAHPRHAERVSPPVPQLDLFSTAPTARWTLSRPLAASRLKDSALRHLESVRRHFPELDQVTIKVGRTKSRRAHAWASLDPEQPAVWIKPGALTRFTVAHEFVHLLQARSLIPRGEKSADLYALARHPELIDKTPSYLKVPRVLFSVDGTPRPGVSTLLHRIAEQAICECEGHPRVAVRRFEQNVSGATGRAGPPLERLALLVLDFLNGTPR